MITKTKYPFVMSKLLGTRQTTCFGLSDICSTPGMTKFDFKVTNLVHKSLYVPTLVHHLRHWLVLGELHLGVPELHPQVHTHTPGAT